MDFNQQVQHQQNWDAYSQDFAPSAIMPKFEEVFIKGKNFDPKAISSLDKMAIEGYRFKRKIRNLSKKLYT